MPRVRLVHLNEDEGVARQKQLEDLGFEVLFEYSRGGSMTAIRAGGEPDAVVIDMSRLPSTGREIGRVIRTTKSTRHWPLVFVDGEDKIAQTKALLPDATYTSWARIKSSIGKAIAHPPSTPIVPKDTMSAKPVVDKLGVKPGFTVALLGAPRGFAETLTPLPKKVTFTAKPIPEADLFVCFARTAREMQAQFLSLKSNVERQSLWMIWPKKASGIKSDLDGNLVRESGLAAGWVDYKVCAVDDTWSGLAFKRRK